MECTNSLDIELTTEEKEMLAGRSGDAVRLALESQLAVAEFFGARRFVPIKQAHVMADWEAMDDAGCEFLQRMVELGAQTAVPTTRNPTSVDLRYARELCQSAELLAGNQRVSSLLRQLGVLTVNTCIGYQTLYQPRFREHVGWGDTGTVIYANSVLGARTNFEAGPAAIAAALTGRVPEYGFHLDAVRGGNVYCRIEARLDDVAQWGALGAVIGSAARDYWNVPIIDPVGLDPSPDDLKHLGASLASYGSMAMFHVAGKTPEAPTVDAAVGPEGISQDIIVRDDDIEAVLERNGVPGKPVDVVVFTAPQLSLFEIRKLAQLIEGRHVCEHTTLLATTNASTWQTAEDEGYVKVIEQAGGLVLRGVCWYLMEPQKMREAFAWERVVTNSAKLVNIIQAHGYEAVLCTTEECVEAAVRGEVVRR
ncbi:aconitase X [soil metagenome]